MTQALGLLSEPFVRHALAAALMVAVVCSFLGVFVVLKRIVFVGASLAEASALGAGVAFLPPVAAGFDALAGALPILSPLEHFKPLLFGLVMMLMAVAFFSQQRLGQRLPREAIIGVAYAGAIGLTLLALSSNPSGKEHAMDALNGNILGVEGQELVELAVTGGVVILLQLLFFKEFVLVSFDPEVARTLGYSAARWELLWYLNLGTMIAVSIHVAGTILVFAYLVIPPVAALLLARRLWVAIGTSILIGTLATLAGVLISISPADTPTSPTIVACTVGLFVLCWLIRIPLDAARRHR